MTAHCVPHAVILPSTNHLGERRLLIRRLFLRTKGTRHMWFRFGKWIEIGLHFGSANERGGVPSRYFLHVRARWGRSEWYHGPVRLHKTAPSDAAPAETVAPRVHFISTLEPVIQPPLWR